MAKDGTMRGGSRPRTGPKKKALADRILDGTAEGTMVLPEPTEITGADMPPVKEFMRSPQKSGKSLCAEEIYGEVYGWLRAYRCERLVNNLLVQQFSMSYARWIQCEECVSEYGHLAKHPTTGNAIASPYVSMSRDYYKQAMTSLFQIQQIVKENSSIEYGVDPQDDLMERLLTARKGNK